MLYVPLEVVMSKYYGESERLLAKVFSLANDLPDGAIIFLDEVIGAVVVSFMAGEILFSRAFDYPPIML